MRLPSEPWLIAVAVVVFLLAAAVAIAAVQCSRINNRRGRR